MCWQRVGCIYPSTFARREKNAPSRKYGTEHGYRAEVFPESFNEKRSGSGQRKKTKKKEKQTKQQGEYQVPKIIVQKFFLKINHSFSLRLK